MNAGRAAPTISPGRLAVLPGAALLASLTRWALQGSGNLYTDAGKQFYHRDPDLGWRLGDSGRLWIGLDLIALLAVAGAAVIAAGWWLRRRERRRTVAAVLPRRLLWLAAALPLSVPIAAFATGGRPAGARDLAPAVAAPATGSTGACAHLDLPAGSYRVVDRAGSAVVARVSAGGETFEARFDRGLGGALTGDPRDLGAPLSARFTVATAEVDTGIDMRSKHAREYFRSDRFPELAITLRRLIQAVQAAPDRVDFTAASELEFLGATVPITVTGSMRRVDDDARTRLGLSAAPAFTLRAGFDLDLAATPLAGDAGDFDDPVIPVIATLILVGSEAGASDNDRPVPATP